MKLKMNSRSSLSSACVGLLTATTILLSSFSFQVAAQERAQSAHTAMPSNREIFGFIQDITDFGPRRSGSEAMVRTADYIDSKFKDFGLQDVTILKGDTFQWDAKKWGLEYDGTTIPAFYMRHSFSPGVGKEGAFSTGSDGLKAEFVYVGNLKDLKGIDVKGKVVVADVELSNIDMTNILQVTDFVHDPDETLTSVERVDPYSPNNYPFNIVSAIKGGAVGFVGILTNYFDSNRYYNEDIAYLAGDDAYFSIPALWVSHEDGRVLKGMLNDKPEATGRLVLEGDVQKVQYRSVVGHLPGKSDEIIMVQSHHDSGFLGAVEDASGVAEVLALAKYYGQQPAKSRERGMMFVSMDTHFTGYESHIDLAENYILKAGRDVVANVTVEHIAKEMIVKDGQAVMTGEVDPRLFISSPTLLGLTNQEVEKHDYRRSLVVSTDFFSSDEYGIPTDAGMIMHLTGMPVISLLSAPAYLYDIADTLDMVAVEELQPTAVMLADMLDSLDTMPREKLGRAD